MEGLIRLTRTVQAVGQAIPSAGIGIRTSGEIPSTAVIRGALIGSIWAAEYGAQLWTMRVVGKRTALKIRQLVWIHLAEMTGIVVGVGATTAAAVALQASYLHFRAWRGARAIPRRSFQWRRLRGGPQQNQNRPAPLTSAIFSPS